MTAHIRPMPDFKTPTERHEYFLENAEFYTETVMIDGFPKSARHHTLAEAVEAAKIKARIWNKPVLVFGYIGQSSEWLQNVLPTH